MLFPPAIVDGFKAIPAIVAVLIVKTAECDAPAKVAVIVAEAALGTVVVWTANVADDAPNGIVTVAGGMASELFEDNVTTSPPGPAGPFNVTVPVEETPAATVVGERVKLVSVAGRTVRPAVTEVVPAVAVMTTGVDAKTGLVWIANGAVIWPEATVRVTGTVAAEPLEDRLTVAPPFGAATFKVTVPVDVPPHTTEIGDKLRLIGTGGVSVSVPDTLFPDAAALTVTGVVLDTAKVVTLKVPVLSPCANVRVEGTVTKELLLLSETTRPPSGEGPFKVTVPVLPVPPGIEGGVNAIVVGLGGLIVRVADADVPPYEAVILA